MPSFDQYPESAFIKMIYMGDTGAGKTGSLCALAAAGYNVRILDLDKGAQIIKGYISDPDSVYLKNSPGLWTAEQGRGAAARMSYVPVSETFTIIGGKPVPKGDSWQKIGAQLTEWKDGEINYGKLETWTPNDVLVIDSFSRFCDAAMYLQLVMNARAISGRQQQDYWQVQDQIERMLVLLTGAGVNCHVVLICHVDYVEKEDKTVRGMPQSMGKALGPKIGQHFNHALLAKSTGQGAGVKRKIITGTTGVIDLKNTAPLKVKPEYELETGLAEYFKAVLGKLPGQAAAITNSTVPVPAVK